MHQESSEGALTVVFVHGIFSRGNPFSGLIDRLREDHDLRGLHVERFSYFSPRLPPRLMRAVPSLDTLADQLETFLRDRVPDGDPLYLVGHSQGGLVVQRMLARQLGRGRGSELARIRGISLFACPNQGSDIALSLRRAFMGWHIQEKSLRPFAEDASEAHRRVVLDIDQATAITATSCPIPMRAYAGAEDDVVTRPSAWGAFKYTGVLSGDHLSILRAESHDSDAWRALRRDVLDAGLGGSPTPHPMGLLVGQVPAEPKTFIARDHARRLSERLGASSVVAITALAGMRGVGKTQIAAAFARQAVADGVPLVAWINAETAKSVYSGLTRVADRLGLNDAGLERDDVVQSLREFLGTWHSPSMFVFDNADDVQLIRSILPATGAARVLITTTNRRFDEIAATLDVSTFERPESIQYLQRRTDSSDRVGADAVADALGDLPLALAAISALGRRRRLSFEECLAELEAYPVADVLGRGIDADYPMQVAAAVLLAVDSAGTTGSPASALLEMVAKLSPDGVDRALLARLVPSVVDSWTARDIEDGLERCVNASLLSWSQDGRTVIMHRLVGRIIRERTRVAGRSDLTLTATLSLLEAALAEQATWQSKQMTLELADQFDALARDAEGSEEAGR